MNLHCRHLTDKSLAKGHNGLCRKCHSNFSFSTWYRRKIRWRCSGRHWYGMILIRLSDDKQATQCFIKHLTDFYSKKLTEVFLVNGLIYKRCSICWTHWKNHSISNLLYSKFLSILDKRKSIQFSYYTQN